MGLRAQHRRIISWHADRCLSRGELNALYDLTMWLGAFKWRYRSTDSPARFMIYWGLKVPTIWD